MQEIPIQGTSFLDEDAQSYPGQLCSSARQVESSFMKTSDFKKINFQLFNAGWSANLAMSPSGFLWSPVWTGVMQKSVIIFEILSFTHDVPPAFLAKVIAQSINQTE